MLYTVRPIERIYMDLTDKNRKEVEEQVFETEFGHVFAKKQDNEYIIDHIVSTNMEDYLNLDFQPGSAFLPKKSERMFDNK